MVDKGMKIGTGILYDIYKHSRRGAQKKWHLEYN